MFHRFLLVASALVIALVAAELILPLVPPHLRTMQRIVHHVDDSGNYYLRPNVEVPFSGMFETLSPPVTWQVNAQGMRSDRATGALSSRFRISTYGDSEVFGWSVDLGDTFQRRMEARDPRLEVLNFGIPGYNAENVADRIEATLPSTPADLVLYLVNKNDVDLPNDISDAVLGSELLLRLRFFWQVVVTKPWRQHLRSSPERLAFLAGQLDRIARFAEARHVRLMFVFMKSYTWEGAVAQAPAGGFVAAAASLRDAARPALPLTPRVVIADDWLHPFARIDDHLPREAHEVLARRLCEVISGNDHDCVPPGWSAAERGATDATVAAANPATGGAGN